MRKLNQNLIHPSWRPLVLESLKALPEGYLQQLQQSNHWLPGYDKIFNAFSLPLEQLRYILFGESPYPRAQSANGYAFWDGAVHELWSATGLAKSVNRATSLRNIVKMLLLARQDLSPNDLSQRAIARIDKSTLVYSIDHLFKNLTDKGVMLLNASLVLSEEGAARDAKRWHGFMAVLLRQLCEIKPEVELILLGKIAEKIDTIPAADKFPKFYAEHPYNLSFITNPKVLAYFQPFDLLARNRSRTSHDN